VDAQAQYDIAKRFTEQADEGDEGEEHRVRRALADKAAALAASC
jgi:hypothetical protein